MNGFHDFDDFRVSAWMDDNGLMIRLAEKARSMANTIKKAVMTAAVCAVAVSTVAPATAAVQVTESSAVNFAFEAVGKNAEFDLISSRIDAELEALMDFSFIDESTLQLANDAVAAIASRPSETSADWAKKIFPLES
jgi:hypothetical protein